MKKLYLALVFLLCQQHFTKAQDNPGSQTAIKAKLNQTLVQFAKHAVYHPVEKIYLHLNKPWYNRADTIRFKAYTVMGNHKLTELSKVAYVLLVNNRDSVLQRINLKLQTGMASGNIILPPSLMPGTYHLKAYTNWMRNGDENYIFDRPINIGGIAPATATATAAPSSQTDIQFFPEGGTLVNGLRNRVAFKAVNSNGLPANIKGSIIAADGSTIAAIQNGHDGMGVFTFTPQEGKTYRASVGSQTIELPKASAEGYELTVNQSTDSLSVIIAANPQLFEHKTGHSFYLVAQAAGKIVYSVSSPLLTAVSDVAISTVRMPTGVVRLTLFSETGQPMQERVVFIQRPDNLVLNVNANKNSYTANEKINLALNAATVQGQPVQGSFSAAVINEDIVPADEAAEPTIFSQLLLSSELHGAINNPAYYFTNKDEKARDDLDMLMLTQGYRKLEWKKLLDTVNKAPAFFAEVGLSISGTVKTKDGKPVTKGNITMLIPSQHIIAAVVPDSTGRFIFAAINITDTASVTLKAVSNNGVINNDVVISLDRSYPKTNRESFLNDPPAPVAEAMKKVYAEQEQQFLAGRQLKQVDVKETAIGNKPDLSSSSNLNGAGHADKVLMRKDLGDCIRLSDCLASRLNGVTVYPDGQIVNMAKGTDNMALIQRAAIIAQTGKDPDTGLPLPPASDVNPQNFTTRPPFEIILDGGQIAANMINNINVDDIYSIEVLTSGNYKNIYGMGALGGVLLITTKHGQVTDEYNTIKKGPGIMNYIFNGYYTERSYYMPKYIEANILKPKQRSAIYWNPDIITDKDGKATLNFTNAGKGNYRVVIEGMDIDGHLARQVYRYKVE